MTQPIHLWFFTFNKSDQAKSLKKNKKKTKKNSQLASRNRAWSTIFLYVWTFKNFQPKNLPQRCTANDGYSVQETLSIYFVAHGRWLGLWPYFADWNLMLVSCVVPVVSCLYINSKEWGAGLDQGMKIEKW